MSDFTPGEVPCPTCGRDYLRDFAWKKLCVSCYLKAKQPTPPQVCTAPRVAAIEPDMLRRLIQLCHPDRHDNSEASVKATRYLLQQREAQHG